MIVNKELPGSSKSLFHLTTGENSGEGGRIPAVFLNPDKSFDTCYHVNGNTSYYKRYYYELNKEYHFVISQQKNSEGEAVYSINVNGETFHEVVNTTPLKFKDVKLYLSDPWHDTFAPFGRLSNLKVITDLTNDEDCAAVYKDGSWTDLQCSGYLLASICEVGKHISNHLEKIWTLHSFLIL